MNEKGVKKMGYIDMAKQRYEWRTMHFKAVNAQEAGEEIERISELHGGELQARDVVSESRDAGAILHPLFEWDDSIAAEKHRENQARSIIGNIVVVSTDKSNKQKPVRAFVHVTQKNDQAKKYVHIETALATPDYMDSLLAQAYKEMEAFRLKYESLEQLSDVFDAMKKISA
jgi:hypothetical protein